MASRDHLRFILNGEDIVLMEVAPDETLLDYLRLRRSLRGTKEGCAEGDCGACTVLVGRLSHSGLVYESVNACIRFLGSLDGQHVVTIEHLRGESGRLHPVQQSIVDHHGSQCGFCTPGFVLSLYALWMQSPSPSEAEIEKSLQGNLCRCTGYASIVKAGLAIPAYGEAAADPLEVERASIAARLKALNDGSTVEIGRDGARFAVPATADSLARMLAEEPSSTVVAGATDVGLWVTKHMREIAPVLFIGQIGELREIAEKGDVLSIGAGVSYTEARAALGRFVPAFGRLIDRIGGEQVRNMGTVGGNIANGSPIGDMPPPLIALGATLNLRRGDERRSMKLEDYFLDYGKQDRRPGEFVESVEVPRPGPDAHVAFHKISKRRDEDITAVLGAFHVRIADGRVSFARIAYGGMAGTPKRARSVEAALEGHEWSAATIEAAMEACERDFTPLTDMRASAEYRMMVAKNLLKRFFLESSGTASPILADQGRAA